MKNYDIHVFQTRDGLYKARVSYLNEVFYAGPYNTIDFLIQYVSYHIENIETPEYILPTGPIC